MNEENFVTELAELIKKFSVKKKEEFFTVSEFAEHLGIHPNTVRKGIKNGRFQAFRIGEGLRSEYRIPSTEAQRVSEMDMMKRFKLLEQSALEKRDGLV